MYVVCVYRVKGLWLVHFFGLNPDSFSLSYSKNMNLEFYHVLSLVKLAPFLFLGANST